MKKEAQKFVCPPNSQPVPTALISPAFWKI